MQLETFQLIDRILDLNLGERTITVEAQVPPPTHTIFEGHFPGYPIMPGVLVIEAMAQTGAILMMSEIPDRHSKLGLFTGIDGAKFRGGVVPGDQLRFEIDVISFRSRAGKMQGKAFVDGKLVCEATLSCLLVPRSREKAAAAEPGQ